MSKVSCFRLLVSVLMAGSLCVAPVSLKGQVSPPAPADAGAAPNDQALPTGGTPGAILPPHPTPPPSRSASSSTSVANATSAASAAAQMVAALNRLKAQHQLKSSRAVANAVHQVVKDNSVNHGISAPMGAKVIAVHKHPGDYVRVGDKIVTLEVDGKQVPILARQAGIMQTLNVSKGGVIGNSRPRAAWLNGANGEQEGSGVELILISPITLFNI